MTKRILAIIAIFLCTTVAWVILGSTIFARTYTTGPLMERQVAQNWGSAHMQAPPVAFASKKIQKTVQVEKNGKKETRVIDDVFTIPLPLEQSRVNVALDLDQRQKGLLWFATYRVAFAGDYLFRNSTDLNDIKFRLNFPASDAIYDDLVILIDGEPVRPVSADGGVFVNIYRPVGAVVRFHVGYRSQGLGSWRYSFGDNVSQVRDFVLRMTTDFDAIDFPEGTVSPTQKVKSGAGWVLTWQYRNLVSGYKIGMTMPEKLQPGPLAGRISFFAPVSLLFFFFLIFIITTLRGIELHPMNYFFLAASFFAFHLLIAYLVDHVSIHVAFAIASAVSIFLVVTYLRLVVGIRFAAVEAALSQFIYLVLFSYAFFFKGFTGLAVTIGAIVTLFVVMQMTGRIKWAERFA